MKLKLYENEQTCCQLMHIMNKLNRNDLTFNRI